MKTTVLFEVYRPMANGGGIMHIKRTAQRMSQRYPNGDLHHGKRVSTAHPQHAESVTDDFQWAMRPMRKGAQV